MKILLLMLISSYLLAETVHSSLSTYYESKKFSNSTQKEDGVVYGVGADIHYKNSKYKLAYEHGDTNTKQPPLKEDLKFDKLFLKYAYEFNEDFEANINYINILNDNIAITDNGAGYGLGLTYNFNKALSTNFTQFYTDYRDFNVYQSDFKINYKIKINVFKIKVSSITKYIDIDEKHTNGFTKYAKGDYLTTGLKVHMHYTSYHFGAGAYFGKRAFAIMNDGFKIQHHAMEFDRTYALGAGKSMGDFVLRFQYVYQRAIELPAQNNKDVKISNLRVIANYKF